VVYEEFFIGKPGEVVNIFLNIADGTNWFRRGGGEGTLPGEIFGGT